MEERETERFRGPFALLVGILLVAGIASAWAGEAAGDTRFPLVSRFAEHSAAWISADGDLIVSGAERQWSASRLDGTRVAEGEFAAPARGAVFVRGKLYFDQGDRIAALAHGSLEPPVILDLEVEEGAEFLLGRINEYLLVVEQRVGVHLLTLPPPPGFEHPPGHRHLHAWPDQPMEVSFTSLETAAIDVAAFGSNAFIALESGGVAVLNTSDSLAPEFKEVLPIADSVSAIAVNGHRLFILGGGGLSTYDLREESPRLLSRVDGIGGTAMHVSGRLVHVAQADAGVATFRDKSIAAVTHFVTLSNFSFAPQSITVEVGDTVQWDNVLGTHDTDSCDVGQVGCLGASTEVWDSGPPTAAPWTFSHTFTLVGANPYSCTLHGGVGMTGLVRVNAAPAPSPPAVPDGDGASNPVRVAKLQPNGSMLQIAFDDSTCSDVGDTQIVGGFGSDLPASPGGTYGIVFSRCACGLTSPCMWGATPLPPSGQFIWFLMTATDGSTMEGLWGQDSAANDRSGPGAGGSSGQCGVTGRDSANVCGN
jgi:plastocyanin